MRLRKAQVQNYRSVVDSTVVVIEDRVTVLIGKNEQGKTTFLKGIESSNVSIKYSAADLPNHMRAELELAKNSEIPIVSLWLSTDLSDASVAGKLIRDFNTIDQIKITKFYDGSRRILAIRTDGVEEPLTFKAPDLGSQKTQFVQIANTLKEKLNSHGSRHAEFQPNVAQAQSRIDEFLKSDFDKIDQIENLIRTLVAGLTSVPGQDAAIQGDITATGRDLEKVYAEVRSIQQNDPQIAFDQLLPQFVFHSTSVDKIPNEVNINDFIKNPETTSRGMANLCRVAGLTTAKIQELANTNNTETRESYEDHFKGNVSGGLNEYWTQETYQIHFRFEKDRMSVSISDETYSPRIPPSNRSDGFQWYLSFYASLLSEVSSSGPIVFVLDNPGLELHADGQRDIKRFLEEKLPSNAQVIYVTHSSAMIDPFNLEQIRQVELKPNQQGTKVSKLAFKDGADIDLYEPVRSAIGSSIAASLMMNDFNILVEGAADKPILEGAFSSLHNERAKKIIINGSLSESPDAFIVRFFGRANLPFVIYVDADSAGREIVAQIKRADVDADKICELYKIHSVPNGRDMELEDLMSVDCYHLAVSEAYPEFTVDKPNAIEGKITKFCEKQFKEKFSVGFNKRRVGEQLKKLLVDGRADNTTTKNLTQLTGFLLEALDKQVGRKTADAKKNKQEPAKIADVSMPNAATPK